MNTNPPAQMTTLDHALLELAIKIKPDEETIKEHRGYAQRILEILQRNRNYKIDRFSFAASFGKRTNVLQSDADCVYFINDHEPPFDEIINEFYDICNQSAVRNLFESYNI